MFVPQKTRSATMFKSMLLTGIIASSLQLMADDPQPYASVHNLPQTPYFFDNGWVLADKLKSATVFIDVNSRDGGGARLAAQNTMSDVQIYCVNMWVSPDPSQKYLFQRFLSNVKQENLADRITPIRMNSMEAARALNIIADVIYLNALEQNLHNEIIAWSSHLSGSGIICGNNWTESAVQIHVTRAGNELDLKLKTYGDFWSLERN